MHELSFHGTHNFINRLFAGCGPYQWARELLVNAQEAGATKVEFGLEWQAVKTLGAYRRMISDNGSGMDREELFEFFGGLGASGKPVGGVHENFGIGAKIACLPWNPAGVAIVSYKNGAASMIRMRLNSETNTYVLDSFLDENGNRMCAVDPHAVDWSQNPGEIDWSTIRPRWLDEHGTMIVLMGSEDDPDTVLAAPPTELSRYLNERFFELGGLEVSVLELHGRNKSDWPAGPNRGAERNYHMRGVDGAIGMLEWKPRKASDVEGRLSAKGTKLLDGGRVRANWWLWDGDRPKNEQYALRRGYVAIKYRNELYSISSSKQLYRMFGIIPGQVQKDLSIVLEPQGYSPDSPWGVFPNDSRNNLVFTGGGEKAAPVPIERWADEFNASLPNQVMVAIQRAQVEDIAGSVTDDTWKRRLGAFLSRWTQGFAAEESTGEARGNTRKRAQTDAPSPNVVPIRAKVPRADDSLNNGRPAKRRTAEDLPNFSTKLGKDSFSDGNSAAMWLPRENTVYLNRDAPLFRDLIRFHQEQYPDHCADIIAREVMQWYGEVAVSKVAHVQFGRKDLSKEEVNKRFLTEEALTVALMGLLSEEVTLSNRLGNALGRRTGRAQEQNSQRSAAVLGEAEHTRQDGNDSAGAV